MARAHARVGRIPLLAAVLLPLSFSPPLGAEGPGEPPPCGDSRGTLRHGGHDREYALHIPAGYGPERPAPITFVLHGGGGLAGEHNNQCTAGTLNRAADRLGMILVYPQGLGRRWQDGREFLRQEARDDGIEPPDDVGFIVALLDDLDRTLNLDRGAVFATGISNGGLMSCRLALDRADIFAAIAPVAANLPVEIAGRVPSRPVSVALFNGTEDPLMPFRDGAVRLSPRAPDRGSVRSSEATLAFFREVCGCDREIPPELLPDADADDGTRVRRTGHENGREGASAVLYAIEGGGHTWPGGRAYAGERLIGRVCRDIDASTLILEFFLAHRRR